MKILLRKNEVARLMGIGSRGVDGLVRDGKLSAPIYPNGKNGNNSWQYYRTIEVLKIGGLNNDEDTKKVLGEVGVS